MSYNETKVPLAQSQESIRRLIYSHNGTGVSFMSHPPREGFEALVTLGKEPYHIRVMATCNEIDELNSVGKRRSKDTLQNLREQEVRRVWRVLFFHLKAMFDAVDSGVIAISDVIMPYIVLPDNRTISEHVVPRLKEISADASRLLR